MSFLEGKKGIITGVVNEYSYATKILKTLKENKAEIGLAFLPIPAVERRVKKIAEKYGTPFLVPMDASNNESIENGFKEIKEGFGNIDFFVHSIAFANTEDLKGKFLDTSRDGFQLALGISAYSLIPMAKGASQLMPNGGSIIALSYLGGERVVPSYNVMGVAKSALESSARYLAYDLGDKNIRVNSISAGPQKTLASSAVGDIETMINFASNISPLKRNVNGDDVGKTALYLLSDLSSGVTGETIHVDCGYSIMGAPPSSLAMKQSGK